MKKIVSVQALPDYRLCLRYDDGVEGEVDLSAEVGKGVFKAWEDPEFFNRVRIGDFGQVEWPDEIDLCPDALYLEITGKSVEELFPNWTKEAVSA
ncbi:MAG TPA: DUF2442 domain-containing protein [Verrucomicrobiae bacterium]|nr:DUF2442 domain-containing protein [Verrucomicrobiae bacterium]